MLRLLHIGSFQLAVCYKEKMDYWHFSTMKSYMVTAIYTKSSRLLLIEELECLWVGLVYKMFEDLI